MWLYNFVSVAGNVGLNVEFDIVIAQTIGECLCHYVRRVEGYLVGCGDIVIHFNREGNAQSGQLFDCLFLIFFCFCWVNSGWSITIGFAQTQFLLNQFGVFGAVCGINQALHSIEVVFTNHWVDGIGSLPVIGKVQTVVPGFTECFVRDCSVPVFIRCAVFFFLIVVEVELVRVLGRNCRYHVVIVFVAWIFCDGIDMCLGQVNIVDFSILIQLEGNVVGFNHLDGNCFKTFALGIPVQWVLGENLLVVMDVGGHGVSAVVPHIFVVHRLNASRTAQLFYHCRGNWIQGIIGSKSIKIRFLGDTMINQRIVIRGFQSDHLAEFGAFLCVQSKCFFFAEGLGVFIVFLCTFYHFQRHGGIGGVVLVEVHNPLQTGSKIFCGTLRFFIAVDVYPLHTLANLEGPGQTAILGSPFFCDAWNQFTVCINFEQTVYQVGQVLAIFCSLRVQDIEGFQLTGNQLGDNQVTDLIPRCRSSSFFFLFLFLLFATLFSGAAGIFSRFFFGCCATASAAAQHKSCC